MCEAIRENMSMQTANMASEWEIQQIARAVILAMREPTEAMIAAAGGETVSLHRVDDPGYEPADVFRTMIDAATR